MKIKETKDKRIRFECISPGVVFMMDGELHMKIEDVRKFNDGILNAVLLTSGLTGCVADHILVHAYGNAELNREGS